MSTKIVRPQRTRPRKCLGERYPMRLGPRLEMLEDRRLLSISIGTDDQDALLSGMHEYERWLDSLRTSSVFSVPIAVVRSEATNTVPTIGEMFDLAADFHVRYVEPAEDYFAMAERPPIPKVSPSPWELRTTRIRAALLFHSTGTSTTRRRMCTNSSLFLRLISSSARPNRKQSRSPDRSTSAGSWVSTRKPTPSLRTFSF